MKKMLMLFAVVCTLMADVELEIDGKVIEVETIKNVTERQCFNDLHGVAYDSKTKMCYIKKSDKIKLSV